MAESVEGHQRRHKTRGKAKIQSKRYYRRKRQQIKKNSKRWRQLNKAKIKRYERRRKNSPQTFKMLPAKAASLALFHARRAAYDPDEDISLRDRDVEFWDMVLDEAGIVDWIDWDGGEVHTFLFGDEGRTQKTYDLYEFMGVAAMMHEDDEQQILDAFDELHKDAEEGGDALENYDYDRS